MSIETLGKLISENERRDAIHVAIAPVLATEKLFPGQPISVVKGESSSAEPHIGIVDPFLKGGVFPGQRFWLFLYPNTVTGMRHHWSHPAFSEEDAAEPSSGTAWEEMLNESREWIQSFANEAGLSFDEIVDIGVNYIDSGEFHTEYHTERSRDAALDRNPEEFWHHIHILTGKKIPEDDKDDMPFNCTC